MTVCRSRAVLLAAVLSVAATARAQIAIDAPAAKDMQSVYVRDSGVAAERLSLAERMERLKEWDKAADVYQEIIEKYPDRMIASQSDEANRTIRYTSVVDVAQQRLARWPEEGLRVYRDRFGPRAQDLLDQGNAEDRATRQRVFGQFFNTDAGLAAGLQLLTSGLERGEFSAAAWAGRRLLELHPGLAIERPLVLFQTGIAEHLAGNSAAAAQRLDALKQQFPAAIAKVRGEDAVLADFLATELSRQPTMVRTFRSDSWPMPFGSPDASAVPEQVSAGGARLFSVELPSHARRGMIRRDQQLLERARSSGIMTGILPAIDNGELFFQDNARIYGISLSSGLPLTGWPQVRLGTGEALIPEAVPTPRGKQLGVTVTPTQVVALLGHNDTTMQMLQGNLAQPTLVSVDRATGRRQWSATTLRLTLPEAQANLKDSRFYGLPMVIGDSVYVLARAMRSGQFEECHLISLRASDGVFQWATYIASTATGRPDEDFDGTNTQGAAAAQMSYADGRLYVLTNLGAIACVDSGDGGMVYLSVYPRGNDNIVPPANPRRIRPFPMPSGPVKPFTLNPPIIADGRLFVMPTDSPYLFISDALSGDLIARLPRQLDARFEPMDMLLGVVGDQLILGNRSTLAALPWRNYDVKKSFDANGGRARGIRQQGDSSETNVRGRPFVTQHYALVPEFNRLNRVNLKTARIESTYPAQGEWDAAEEQPGNVVATPDYLVIAGPSRVTVYADLDLATGKLDEQIRQDPSALEPYLRYAELLFAGGRSSEAITRIDQAMERLGGRTKLTAGPQRDRVFEITLNFAQKLQQSDKSDPQLIRQLFTRAGDAAMTPLQQVRYRQAYAALLRKAGDAAGEMSLHEQVLANADWRPIPVVGKQGAATAAGEAERAIVELAKIDPAVGQAHHARAEAALQRARDAAPEALLAVADAYPTTPAAVTALIKAADAFESRQQLRPATQTLRRLLQRAASNDQRRQALEALARCYMKLPNQTDLAVARLDQAKQLAGAGPLSKPILLPNGQVLENITLDEAAKALRDYRSTLVGQHLATLGVPMTTDGNRVKPAFKPAEALASVSSIVAQTEGARRSDRVVAMKVDGSLIQLEAGKLTPLHPPVKLPETPTRCAFLGDALLLHGPTTLYAIGANGTLTWQAALADFPRAEATASDQLQSSGGEIDPLDVNRAARLRMLQRMNELGLDNDNNFDIRQQLEQEGASDGVERIMFFKALSDRVVIGTSAGRVASLDVADGAVHWQARPFETPIWHFHAIDDFVAFSTAGSGEGAELVVLDAISGQIIQRTAYTVQQQLMNLALSPEGMLVTLTPDRMTGRDLFEPSRTWEQNPRLRNPNEFPFINNNDPRQLVITDGRILAVHMSMQQAMTVRAYNLQNGLPMLTRDPRTGKESDAAYTANVSTHQNNPTPQLSINTSGPAFYVVGPKSLASYHLDQPEWQWFLNAGAGDRGVNHDFVLCRDFAVLIHQPSQLPNAAAEKVPSVQLSIHSRATAASGRESGSLEQRPTVRDPASVLLGQWQVANGAFYYVSGDQKLKMLKANSE